MFIYVTAYIQGQNLWLCRSSVSMVAQANTLWARDDCLYVSAHVHGFHTKKELDIIEASHSDMMVICQWCGYVCDVIIKEV